MNDYLKLSLTMGEVDERHCQRAAMGALLFLDHELGAHYAEAILATGGLWAQWPGSSGVCLSELYEETAAQVAFARGADPGVFARSGGQRIEFARR